MRHWFNLRKSHGVNTGSSLVIFYKIWDKTIYLNKFFRFNRNFDDLVSTDKHDVVFSQPFRIPRQGIWRNW
jgi:hypothetical protein